MSIKINKHDLVLILVIIGIIVIFALKNSSDEDQNQTIKRKGTIKLLYQISKNNFQTEPISEEYIKENEFDLYVEGILRTAGSDFLSIKPHCFKISSLSEISVTFSFTDCLVAFCS